MENVDKKDIIDDAFQLCEKAIRTKDDNFEYRIGIREISIEPIFDDFRLNQDGKFLYYSQLETTNFLIRKEIIDVRNDEEKSSITFIDDKYFPKKNIEAKGFLKVNFNYEKAEDFINEIINKRIGNISGIINLSSTFDSIKSEIIIGSTSINIKPNTKEYELCKAILKNRTSKNKVWEWEDIFYVFSRNDRDELNDYEINKFQHSIYNIGRQINIKVCNKFPNKKFLILSIKTIQLNPIFI
ncbi:MAG: hypothetical protein WC489_01980 [Patescibacteria group bacterium]